MKKQVIVAALLITIVVQLTSCGSNCKEKDCDEEVFHNGYCEIHYYAHKYADELKELMKDTIY